MDQLNLVGHGGVGGVCPVSFETSVEELGLSSTGQLSGGGAHDTVLDAR